MKFHFSLIILSLFAFNSITFSQNSSCKDSASYHQFRNKWNEKVKIFTSKAWILPEINFLKQKGDSFDMVQPLVNANLSLAYTVTKEACVKKVSVKSKKDDTYSVQSLVSMIYVMEIFNHELNASERQKTLDELKFEAEKTNLKATKLVGKNTYYYEPGTQNSVFTIIPG